MCIKEVRDTIIRWTKGCTTFEQLQGLEKFTMESFPVLFDKLESALLIDLTKGELIDTIFLQKEIIKNKISTPLKIEA